MYSLLIVDDEAYILEGLREVVENSGLALQRVRTAASAAEALRLFQAEPFDLILTDISMPGMNGLDMARETRRVWPYTEIIFLTGYKDFEYARAALRLGGFEYLLKPVTDEELIACLQKAVDRLEEREDGAEERARRALYPGGVERALSDAESPGREPQEERSNALVLVIRDYIDANPAADLSLGSLARRFRASPSYLSRAFHQTVGTALSAYITGVRVEAAKRLLSRTNEKIYEIARKTGFDTPGYFAKVFSKQVGMSPKEYRVHKSEQQ